MNISGGVQAPLTPSSFACALSSTSLLLQEVLLKVQELSILDEYSNWLRFHLSCNKAAFVG